MLPVPFVPLNRFGSAVVGLAAVTTYCARRPAWRIRVKCALPSVRTYPNRALAV